MQLDRKPADLRLARAEDLCAGRPRDELRAEADAEQRRAVVEQALEPAQLRRQPAVALVLVGMHRAAEDDHGVGTLWRRAAELYRPLDELVPGVLHGVGEDAGTNARAVRDCEDTHGPSPRYFFGFAGMTTRTELLLSATAARFAERHVTPNVGVHGTVPAAIVPRTFR